MADETLNRELSRMKDIDSIIASILPNMSLKDPEEVKNLQVWLNLKYGDDLLVDGDYGSKTSATLNTWLRNYEGLQDMGAGATNTLINPKMAIEEGERMGFTPFHDMEIAQNVSISAQRAKGSSDIIDSVLNELTIDNLGDASGENT